MHHNGFISQNNNHATKIILNSKWLPHNFKTNYILGINKGNHRVSPL